MENTQAGGAGVGSGRRIALGRWIRYDHDETQSSVLQSTHGMTEGTVGAAA